MTTDTFLKPGEIIDLTNRKVRTAQVRALRTMGIEHKVRPDGTVAILRAHINKIFDGAADAPRKTKPAAPNWAAM